MTLYRALRDLKTGQGVLRRGSWFPGNSMEAKTVSRLRELEAITELSAPPLTELPEFNATVIQALRTAGIVHADQLLEQPIELTSQQSGLTTEELKRWRSVAARWLTVDDEHG